MNCPTLRADVPSPCPRLHAGKCDACKEDLIERSALIEFGGMKLSREEADALAVRMAADSLPGQRPLL